MKYIIFIYSLIILLFLTSCCINKYEKIYFDGTKQSGTEYKFLFINLN